MEHQQQQEEEHSIPEERYSDEFVDVDSKGITIKWYYFPTTMSKFIPWEHVKGWELRSLENLIPAFDFKSWGMGMSDVWWACDMKRFHGEHPGVLLTTGSWIRKGFSCREPHTVLHLIALHAGRAAADHQQHHHDDDTTKS